MRKNAELQAEVVASHVAFVESMLESMAERRITVTGLAKKMGRPPAAILALIGSPNTLTIGDMAEVAMALEYPMKVELRDKAKKGVADEQTPLRTIGIVENA